MKQIKNFSMAATLVLGISAFSLPLILSTSVLAVKRVVSIGTGGPTGVYFIAGNAICKMIQRHADKKKTALRCSAPATDGSIYNINAIRLGDLDIGVVQSDIQQQALNGTGNFEDKKFEKARSLFSVHAEPFQILVAKDSGIKNWADLAGKRVNIGNPGSGQRGTFEALMLAYNIDGSYFSEVNELSSTEQSKALCDGKIDAFAYSVGVPNAGVAQATDKCGARIITLRSKTVDRLVSSNPYFAYSKIPKGTYKTTTSDVMTFGVMATVVANADTNEDTVYQIVRAVFENIAEFRKLHPAFAKLQEKRMISDGLSAPLHPGAVKYYKEKGWLE